MLRAKHLFVLVLTTLIVMIGFGAMGSQSISAQTVKFNSAMHTSKNLTYNGTIKYYVKSDAKNIHLTFLTRPRSGTKHSVKKCLSRQNP